MKKQASFTIGLLILTATACKSPLKNGDYHGNATLKNLSGISNHSNEPIRIKVEKKGNRQQTILVLNWNDDGSGQNQPLLSPLILDKIRKDHFSLQIPNLQEEAFRFIKVNKETMPQEKQEELNPKTCFKASSELSARFCYNSTAFTLEISNNSDIRLALEGTLATFQAPLDLETPGEWSISEAADRVLQRNFDLQEARQLLILARETANRAYLNLLPHGCLGDSLPYADGLTSDLTSVALDLSDPGWRTPLNELAPFIFPTRWIEAKSLTWQARAQDMAFLAVRADTVTALQSVGIAYVAQAELTDELILLKEKSDHLIGLAADLLKKGMIDENFLLTTEIVAKDLNAQLKQTKNNLNAHMVEFSRLMGFENPQMVTRIHLGDETATLAEVPLLNDEQAEGEKMKYAKFAVMNSFDLQQLTYLRKSALLNETNVFVNWFDTAATMGVGFTLIPDKRMAHAQVKKIDIRTKKRRRALIVEAYNRVRDRNILRNNAKIFEENLALSRQRLELIIDEMSHFEELIAGGSRVIRAADLKNAVKDTLDKLQGYYGSRAAVQIDQAVLDRMALRSVYRQILPHLDPVTETLEKSDL